MVNSEASTTPSTSTMPSSTHLIVFVHGWLGNENELSYLRGSMERQKAQQQHDDNIVFHSAKCNAGNTNDGIYAGGKRLAEEVLQKLKEMEQGHVFLSLVGNSLGGLYSRCAISHMDLDDDKKVTPFVFCTISTPHLGNHSKEIETAASDRFKWILGKIGGSTPQDLFMQTPTIRVLGTDEIYLAPLRKFQKRIALANAYRTDVLVSTRTGVFLSSSPDSTTLYTTINTGFAAKKNFALALETTPCEDYNKQDMSECLDSLGWTKVLLDIRDDLPFPSISNPFKKKEEQKIPDKEVWTAKELTDVFDRTGPSWKIPLGHQVSSVNSKNKMYSRISSGGKPTMDQLGEDLLGLVRDQRTSSGGSISTAKPSADKLVRRDTLATALCVGGVSFEEDSLQPIVSVGVQVL